MSIEHELQDHAFDLLFKNLEDQMALADEASVEAKATNEHIESYHNIYTYSLLQQMQISLMDHRIKVVKERLAELDNPEQLAAAG